MEREVSGWSRVVERVVRVVESEVRLGRSVSSFSRRDSSSWQRELVTASWSWVSVQRLHDSRASGLSDSD